MYIRAPRHGSVFKRGHLILGAEGGRGEARGGSCSRACSLGDILAVEERGRMEGIWAVKQPSRVASVVVVERRRGKNVSVGRYAACKK